MNEQLEQQKRTNVSNKMYGRYRAKVVNTVHPDELYMVTVRVLDHWDAIPDEDLPFAEFELPLGAKPSAGQVVPVEPDDLVWVHFPNGDTRYPLITGSVYHAPEYKSNLPDEVNGNDFATKRSPNEPPPPKYDRKDELYDRFGLREHKSHEGGWSITHKKSGTAIEITPEGKCVIHTEGDQFQSATGKHLGQYGEFEILVKGNATIKTDGDALVDAKGNATVKCAGDGLVDSKGKLTLKSAIEVFLDAPKVGGKAMDYDFK